MNERERILAGELQKWVSVRKIFPCGTLESKRGAKGIVFYFRAYVGGKTNRFAVGSFDEQLPRNAIAPSRKGYSIEGAARAAAAMADKHQEYLEKGGYAAYLKEVSIEKEAIRIAEQLETERFKINGGTLNGLMDAYIDYLTANGRASAQSVCMAIRKHIIDAHPELIAKFAKDISSDDIANIIRPIHLDGKGRTANKIRSYLHAAFQIALEAKYNPSLPQQLIAFELTINPVSIVGQNSDANRADKNPLDGGEMKQYWQLLNHVAHPRKQAALKLHLLLGAPRIIQLVRLNHKDVREEYLILQDLKGKSRAPRPYYLPITDLIREQLDILQGDSDQWVLSTDEVNHLEPTTLSHWAKFAVGDEIENFTLKRTRSGVETLLASLKISGEIRGYLQSHGIGGVQDKHYNAYDFLDEKRDALLKLERFLTA
ncbi:putative integrase [Vitreoscilla sp. C1]|uniref:integrase n=1 Tax=Vitreoscilla sp. (strain C1) TaxID=96942 RepID=UPI000CDC8EAA|nr:integrase [Vitreoscilla sp. C1]AUZ06315.1 putative integrase [Vitreoscilla sp. C1]